MKENRCLGMNSTTTLSAVPVSELHLGSDDGSLISDTLTVMDDERLGPSDNLAHFGLGPC